jgi:uncharacterized protein (TIGR00299 family) protein
MNKILYIDAFSGISGDMFLGALIALGFDAAEVDSQMERLGIPARLVVERVTRSGITAVNLSVVDEQEQKHERNYGVIKAILEQKMSRGPARDMALLIFSLLAVAEAHVHGTSPDHVHFHEIGAVDSIVDIVGISLGLAALGPMKVVSSPLPLGRGFVKARHGVLPLPAPATVALLSGIPVEDAGIQGELVTPTGAAVVKAVAENFSGIPPMIIEKDGYGAGDRELPDRPNLLRLVMGRAVGHSLADEVEVITTHIDDMNPQLFDYVMSRLFEEGALDATLTPVIMKKGRPATMVTVIADPSKTQAIVDCIFSETSSIGLRIARERRVKLERRIETVHTQYGDIRVKVISDGSGNTTAAYPEYEDVRAAAQRHGISIDGAYRLIVGTIEAAFNKGKGRP